VLDPGEPAVGEICRRLDGMPLAIELAAAGLGVLSLAQIADRLHDRFGLLTRGSRTALPRHQTLRATLDWSHDLLTEPEQVLFRRLAVFAGGFALEAAEAVCTSPPGPLSPLTRGVWVPHSPVVAEDSPSPRVSEERGPGGEVQLVLDLLAQLVNKSLVITEVTGAQQEMRYHLLETVRQYAGDKLEAAGEGPTVRGRHRDWCLALAAQAEPELDGPQQGMWLERLDLEHDNLRAALAWLATSGEMDAWLCLAGALAPFWERSAHLSEGRRWLEQGVAASGGASVSVRAKVLGGAGLLAHAQGDLGLAAVRCEESLLLYRSLGDERSTAAMLTQLSEVMWRQGDFARSTALTEEALALHRRLGDLQGIARSMNDLGMVATRRGEHERARALLEESLALRRRLVRTRELAASLVNLGVLARDEGDYPRASAWYEEGLAVLRDLGDQQWTPAVTFNLGEIAKDQGDCGRARALVEESLALFRERGDEGGMANACHLLGELARLEGDVGRATALFKEGLALSHKSGSRLIITYCLEGLAGLAAADGRPGQAARLFGAAAGLRDAVGNPLPPADRDTVEHAITGVRAALGEELFAGAWAAGRALPLEQVIAEILEIDRLR
jgi:non-specific serine/threonine protein kinase